MGCGDVVGHLARRGARACPWRRSAAALDEIDLDDLHGEDAVDLDDVSGRFIQLPTAGTGSPAIVQNLPQLVREFLGLPRVPEFFIEEATVMAREHGHTLTE